MSLAIDPFVQLLAAGATGIVFARALVEKSSNFVVYAATLRDYRLVPEALAPFAAVCLFVAEISTLFMLALPETRATGAMLAIVLLALYALAMSLALFAGREEIECGCGGEGQVVSWSLVARNAVLLLIAAVAASTEALRDWNVADTALAVTGGLSLFLLYAAANRLLANWPALAALRH